MAANNAGHTHLCGTGIPEGNVMICYMKGLP